MSYLERETFNLKNNVSIRQTNNNMMIINKKTNFGIWLPLWDAIGALKLRTYMSHSHEDDKDKSYFEII